MTQVQIAVRSLFQITKRKAQTVTAAWSYPWKILVKAEARRPVRAALSRPIRAEASFPVRAAPSRLIRANLSPVRTEPLKQVKTSHKDFRIAMVM